MAPAWILNDNAIMALKCKYNNTDLGQVRFLGGENLHNQKSKHQKEANKSSKQKSKKQKRPPLIPGTEKSVH